MNIQKDLYGAINHLRMLDRMGELLDRCFANDAEHEQALSAFKSEAEKSYRKLALKAHPDHGGDIEEMKRLNASIAMVRQMQRLRQPAPQPPPMAFDGGCIVINLQTMGFGWPSFTGTTSTTGWW
jgi:hypothetical protein